MIGSRRRRTSAGGRWFAVLLALAPFASASACSGSDRSFLGGLGDSPGIGGPRGGPCKKGSIRSCTITLGKQGNVHQCFAGVQSCEDGVWAECADGEFFDVPSIDPDAGARLRTKALSQIDRCDDNPCDPSCRVFEERPDAALTTTLDAGSVPASWRTGRLRDYSADSLLPGRGEPCTVAADCQFNSFCQSPGTGSCAHGPCEAGASLVGDCSECVGKICSEQSECCFFPAGCAHDPCVAGAALSGQCDPCVSAICAGQPECCDSSWGEPCVAAVDSICGALAVPQTCGCAQSEVRYENECYLHVSIDKTWQDAADTCRERGAGWDLVHIDDADENAFIDGLVETSVWIGATDGAEEGAWTWSDGSAFWTGGPSGMSVSGLYSHWDMGEPADDPMRNCAIVDSYNDDWRPSYCFRERDSVCEGPAALSAPGEVGSWTAQCENLVQPLCGSYCDAQSPGAANGLCEIWYPGMVDSQCESFDVAVGLPCLDGDERVVPVCNHGTMPAPEGLSLVVLPPGQMGSETPDVSGASRCATAEPIAPGECIEVLDCPSLEPGREIMVNPRDGSEVDTECRFDDNWSVYEDVQCSPAICSGESSSASVAPVNMLFVVDRSRSMQTEVRGSTRWEATATALKAFFFDPASAGLGVALRFFPEDLPVFGCNQNECDQDACSEPRVPLGTLVTDFAPADAQEEALFAALNSTTPMGLGTPIHPALQGAMQWAASEQTRNPKENYVVVLVTDGEPTDCNTNIEAIASLARDAFEDYGVRTYTLGVDEEATAQAIETIAAAGGGRSFLVSGTGTASITDQVLDSFRAIAGETISCDFELRNVGGFDPAKATAEFSFPESSPAAAAGPYCSFHLGEVHHGASCYYASTARAYDWAEARDSCRERGAGWDLVSIGSSSENSFIDNLVGDTRAWIGLNDQTMEGVFAWSGGQCVSPDSYTNFLPGEPNDGDCPDCAPQNCVVLDEGGQWTDDECEQWLGLGFVCEGPTIRPPGACRAGQFEGPDATCYALVGTPTSYDAAREACQSRGAGWDVATVGSEAENDFATGLLDCEDAWIRQTDSYENYVPPGDGNGCPLLRQDGNWQDEDCDRTATYLCEGPKVAADQLVTESLEAVADEGACSSNSQWYFDDPRSPTVIHLCPDTCERVRGRSTGRLTIEAGCPETSRPSETTYSQLYRAVCSAVRDGGGIDPDAAATDEFPQWGFLTYEAEIPGGSSIRFLARTAATEEDIEGVEPVLLKEATAASQDCGFGATDPSCPVDVFVALGAPANVAPVLELSIVLVPGSNGEAPSLTDWDLTFSCVAGL